MVRTCAQREPLSRHAVAQASRNLCTGADRSGAPTVPSFTKGIDAPASNANPRLAAFVFQASRDFWMFAIISASTAGSSARAMRGASVVVTASPAMRRRDSVLASYAWAGSASDASKSSARPRSNGMTDNWFRRRQIRLNAPSGAAQASQSLSAEASRASEPARNRLVTKSDYSSDTRLEDWGHCRDASVLS